MPDRVPAPTHAGASPTDGAALTGLVTGLMTGLVLAGGRGRRLGGRDKGLVAFGGRPLIAWVLDALTPQVGGVLISANRNLDRYRALGWPVLSDQLPDFQGPLAGLATALAACPTPWLLTLPCDGPCPPPDLAARLAARVDRGLVDGWVHGVADGLAARQPSAPRLAVAHDGARLQPLYALLPRALAPDLANWLARGGRRVEDWFAAQRPAVVDFSDRPLGFANLNRPEDAARLAAALGLPGVGSEHNPPPDAP